ncbi:acyl-CoA dehydrogenase family protein [Undibacterium sp. Jales W-56]|uniref:acyl-CoA dehydrogenase family protein n=1 Tax=Undibacterium sp. Jales W-56 TaxID=2897325 RepID=UPI0021D3D799|nr:acyl-CoA dehydrogenase family protein [Undibacterium sp. Jales W-56]MCU6433294.1 acyl-CoA dehydrogenase family protein [Undibacterium sp. Jales W-56]
MIPRTLFGDDHQLFRDTVRRFMEAEVAPHHARWDEQGYVDRDLWSKAGAAGFLCPSMPEQYGGSGVDILFSVILMEEQFRIGATGPGFGLHSEIVAPYILHQGSEYLKSTYLPRLATGEMIGAIAMTEPGAGSDLQGIKTSAVKDGEHYILNGSKTFITNGWHCDLVIVVARTDPDAGSKGISLFVVDTTMPGFTKGKRLHKMGMSAQDTSELFFDQVRVPAQNLLGEEGRGFACLMQELPWERLQIALTGVAAAQAALDWTIQYTRDRQAFGRSVIDFQTVSHKLAEMKTEIAVGQVFIDRCIELKLANKLDAETASMAKYWATEMQFKVMDQCVQLHGGYGYMHEYPIARAWADARVQRIYGGTNEIMKELISRTL